MTALTRFALAHPGPILVVEFLLTLALVAGIPLTRTETGYRTFLGDDHPAIIDLEKMIQTFGGGLPVFVAWECRDASPCKSAFDDASLEMIIEVTRRLEDHPLVTRVQSPANSPIIVSRGDHIQIRQIVEAGAIVTDRDELARQAMDDPLWQGTLTSPDGKVGALVVQLSSTESSVASEIVPAIQEALAPHEAAGFRFYLVGDPVDFVVAGGQLRADTPVIVVTMIGFLVVAAWFLLRSWVAVALALANAGLAVGWAMGAMSWLGWPEIEITQALRPGILAISLCAAIHVVTRYVEHAENGPRSTIEQRKGWIEKVTQDVGAACLLTALTTAAGFLSFTASGMTSFSRFGITAAIGVGSGLLLSFTALPIALSWIDPRRLRSERMQRGWGVVLRQIGIVAEQRPRGIFVGSAVLMLASFAGINQLRVDVDERELFGENAEVVRWARFFEENLRKSDSLEIHLTAPEGRSFLEPEGVEVLSDVSEYASGLDGLGKAASVLDLLSVANRASHAGDSAYFRPAETHRENAELVFLMEMAPGQQLSPWLSYDRDARISIPADPTSTDARTLTLARVSSYLDQRLPEGWGYTLSGPLAVYLAFSDAVQRTQLWSFAVAGAVVACLLCGYFLFSGLRGRAALEWTFIGMFPTVLPVVVTLGTMGLLDIPLDAGTAMVAAILLGIAVDDSIHLITAFRESRKKGLETRPAILDAISRTGQALVTSSVALSVGSFALMNSSWQSIASFGLLSGVAIWGALIADLVVLPAIILSFRSPESPTRSEPSTISDIPNFSERSGTSLMTGLFGAYTLWVLLSGLVGGSPERQLPCLVESNGAVSPFSIVDPSCPLGSGDVVHAVVVEGKAYPPEKAGALQELASLPAFVDFRVASASAGNPIDVRLPTAAIEESERTIRFALACLAVLLALFMGLSVLWLSSAQAAIPFAIVCTALGVAAAGLLAGPLLPALSYPFLGALALAPTAMIHLAVSFPRRSTVLQHARGVLGALYGGAIFLLIGLAWGASSHPSVWKVTLFVAVSAAAVAWLRILLAGLVSRQRQDRLERSRSEVATRSSLVLIALFMLVVLGLPIALDRGLALGLMLIPGPLGYALVKYQFFDVRPYARALGLVAFSSLLYVGVVGVLVYSLTYANPTASAPLRLGIALAVLFVAEMIRLGLRTAARRRLPADSARLRRIEMQFLASLEGQSSEQKIGQILSQLLVTRLASDGVSVALRCDDTWRIVAARGTPPRFVTGLRELEEFLVGRTAPVYLGPEGGERSDYGAILRVRRVAVAAPLRSGNQLVGAVLVSPPRGLLPYQKPEIELIRRVSHHAAAAICNARLTDGLLRSERSATLEWIATGLMHSVGRPMTIISRSTQRIAQQAQLPDRFGEFVEDVRLASQETLEGLEQLRVYAATGRLGRSSPEPVQSIVERAVQIVSRLHDRAGLVARPAADLPLVLHGEEIRRVLISLLDNAVNATGPTDAMPEIRATFSRGHPQFEVKDFGCGMAPNVLEQATRAFFTTRREDGGSGIGLLDAKSTVERLGGSFRLDSVEHEGTTATIVLPAALVVEGAAAGLGQLQ